MAGLRIVFAGSPEAAVPSLRALLASRHEVVTVVTRPDSPQGRRRELTPTPVATLAESAGVPVLRATTLAPVSDALIALGAELGVVVAYGGLIREPLLSAPRHGWVNLHFSLLPRWRGAAPVQRAIMAGDERTGAAVFRLVPELDAGPVYAMEATAIGRHATAGEVLAQLAQSGAGLLVRTVDAIADGTATAVEQSGEPSFAPKLSMDDAKIRWRDDGTAVANRIRGVTPEPGAFSVLAGTGPGERLKVLRAAPASGIPAFTPGIVQLRDGAVVVGTGSIPLELIEVQPAGKRPMPAVDWFRGRGGRETAFE